MKLNFAYPATGQHKTVEFEDEKKLRVFFEKRMAQEVEIDSLGDEWKGYVVRIAGGNDKQGFPMMQGVLTNGRVRLLLKKGQTCYRIRKDGERKRKSVRGCIVDANLSALSLVVVKKGDNEIEGLTDQVIPRPRGPKRASKIRKLFNLTKDDDVTKYVITHVKPGKEGKRDRVIAPKIQRLITPTVIGRRKQLLRKKREQRVKSREEAQAYHKLMAKYAKEQKDSKIARRRSSASRSSESDVKKTGKK